MGMYRNRCYWYDLAVVEVEEELHLGGQQDIPVSQASYLIPIFAEDPVIPTAT